jgi:integrase/recombinase XerD
MAMKRKIKVAAGAAEMPIGQALDEFVVEKEAAHLKPKTIENYLQSLRLFMECEGLSAETPLNDITLQNIYHWIGKMTENGVSPSSINHYLRDCRCIFYWCMERDYMEKFQVKMVEKQEEPPKLFDNEDIEALLEKPHKPTATNDYFTEWRTWAVVNWIMGTGSRCSSIVEVRMGDIDFAAGEVAIRHTKNKKPMILPISTSLETALKEYIRMFRKGADDDDYLFCNIGDEQLTTNALRHSFQRYCANRGVNQTNLHGLRHSFAKGWIRSGGDVFRLQKILGHSSLDMSRKYVAIYSEDLKDDYDRYSPLDNIKKGQSRKKAVKAKI